MGGFIRCLGTRFFASLRMTTLKQTKTPIIFIYTLFIYTRYPFSNVEIKRRTDNYIDLSVLL